MKNHLPLLTAILLWTFPVAAQLPEIELHAGMEIRQSCRIKPGAYPVDAPPEIKSGDQYTPVLVITGNNLVVDFQDAVLLSRTDPERPDRFTGLAIEVYGRNITIKNARIQGFKVALLAHDCASGLVVEHSDFSYNYRPRLRSIREREDFSDWLSYHQNDNNEWLRYGAGIYLDNCQGATVRECRITGNQNALLMRNCNDGRFYNNVFHFNSGLGIGMYRSSRNKVMHNRLDWNVRGYSHGFYQRGQDSAALLVYEQSSENTFAFNSCSHSGDGFFLWAGQHTMDTGEGGCNDNLIFNNDFSSAPTNGIEVTFSRNIIQGNTISECTYGIWGGYSFESLIMGNAIMNCRTGIAIEHGQKNTIRQNLLQDDSTGIQLWARAEQPSDWAYARKRDTRSMDAVIDRNVFLRVRKPLLINRSENIDVNGENLFVWFDQLLTSSQANQNLRFIRNEIFAPEQQLERIWQHPELTAQEKLNFPNAGKVPDNLYYPLDIPAEELKEPASMPGAMLTNLPIGHPRGRKNIIVDEWGPYDFLRPLAVMTPEQPEDSSLLQLQILGPAGEWQITTLQGLAAPDVFSGNVPATLTLKKEPGVYDFRATFSFTGKNPVVNAFGQSAPPTTPYAFEFRRFEQQLPWDVSFYNYDEKTDPLKHPEVFARFRSAEPVYRTSTAGLYFAWWGSPAGGVQEDRFATVSTSTFTIKPGRYRIELGSDDGVRLYLDDQLILENWDVHEPESDEITVALGGTHTIRIEHFDAGGFATLDFRINPE